MYVCMYVCMYLSTSTGLSTYISVFIYLFISQPTLIYTNEMVNLTLTCLHLPGIGLSDTLGAFLAGLLLSETSYRYQIEARLSYIHILNIVLFCLLYVCMYVCISGGHISVSRVVTRLLFHHSGLQHRHPPHHQRGTY